MFHVRNAYSTEDIGLGEHLEYPSQFSPMVDSRGDSITREPVSDSPDQGGLVRAQQVHVDRPDGVVTFKRSGDFVDFAGVTGSWNVGDLNGDGRSDYILSVGTNLQEIYIVSGTVSPGVHDPRDVGVRVDATDRPNEGSFSQFRPVGDQNGDGGDDIAVGGKLYEGRELLAHRHGSEITALPKPFQVIPNLISTVRLDPSGPPTMVQVNGFIDVTGGNDAIDHAEVKLSGKTVDCLLTAPGPVPSVGPDTTGQNLQIVAWRTNGHRVIGLQYANRSGTTEYRWDLDA